MNTPYLDVLKSQVEEVVERFKRYEIIKEKEPMAEEYLLEDAEIVLVSFGATARIVKSAVNSARRRVWVRAELMTNRFCRPMGAT